MSQNTNVLLIDNTGLQLPIETLHIESPEQMTEFADITPDVILITVAWTSHINAIRAQAPKTPVIILIDQDTNYFEIRVGKERVLNLLSTEQLTKTLLMNTVQYLVKHAQQEAAYEHTNERFQRIIDDHRQLRRIDRELGYTLNLDHILNLAMDTALRLTAASAVVIGWLDEETGYLDRLASIGAPKLLTAPIPAGQRQNNALVIRVFEPGQDLKFQLILPLIVQNRFMGLMGLENIPAPFCCDQTDLDFLTHLSSRTAAALEKTQIYQRTRYQAIQMDKLYVLSNDIAHHLEREDIMEASAASMAVLIDGSSAFFCEYDPPSQAMIVRSSFVVEGMPDSPMQIGCRFALQDYSGLFHSLFDDLIQISQNDLSLKPEQANFMKSVDAHAVLLVPLIDRDFLLGMIVLCESRYDRYFNTDEIALARSLAGSATVALKKANLFAEVQELEQLKSEMIRMASHDLRAPLSRIVFSVAMLEVAPEQKTLIEGIQDATEQMKSLLEDILNLERIESEEATRWQHIDGIELVQKVSDNFAHEVGLNGQTYQLELSAGTAALYGSEVQLQQAFSNYISNALKYTPRGGTITTRAWIEGGRFLFEVEDSGYGIPKDRHEKMFSRFYRARTPGTESIPGTGLGLSLVKTVIERHGGGVWFHSEVNEGSVFGCWLPLDSGA